MTEVYKHIKLTGALERSHVKAGVKQEICDRMRHMDLDQELTTAPATVKLFCLLVEEMIPQGNSTHLKLDKKALVLECISELFPDVSQLELAAAARTIEFFCESGSIIRASRWRRIKRYLCRRFLCQNGDLSAINSPVQH